ncbi:hypothetical protein Q7A53_04630 [Halobacillus rhizosphaerae]|uniref:hypothetical protein n=1 Tax=Halobacillus rhizosphaerae TaxID=3064889 RepID=UPI00398BAA56
MNPILSSILKTVQAKAAVTSQQPIEGQYIAGKVIKLFPGNGALVQLGAEQLQAQLETSLTKGERYLFQVKSTGDQLHLAVVSSQKTEQQELANLFQVLGLKKTKHSYSLVRQLLQKDISFHKQDLNHAVTLLNQVEEKTAAVTTLLKLFEKQLPIKPSVFQAFYTKETKDLTQEINKLSQSVSTEKNASNSAQKVADLISRMKNNQPEIPLEKRIAVRLVSEADLGINNSFKVLKKAGLYPENYTFTQFNKDVQSWKTAQEIPSTFQQDPIGIRPIPEFLIPRANRLVPQLKQLFDQQLPLTTKDRQMVKQWVQQLKPFKQNAQQAGQTLRFSEKNLEPLLKNYQSLMERKIFEKIVPALEPADKNALSQAVKNLPKVTNGNFDPVEWNSLLPKLEKLEAQQLSKFQQAVLTEWISGAMNQLPETNHKDLILLKIKLMMHAIGSSEEAMINHSSDLQQKSQNEQTLRSLMLQMQQDAGRSQSAEGAKQLQHLLNGIQLSSHQVTNQSIQFSLQFPGFLLDSAKDIHVNVEGRKNSKNEIDPDFCRVVFYLDLESMKETVIDLNISERHVAVTVFNQLEESKQVLEKHKAALEQGLTKLGYTLTSIHYKTHVLNSQHPAASAAFTSPEKKGLDIRI